MDSLSGNRSPDRHKVLEMDSQPDPSPPGVAPDLSQLAERAS